MTRRAAACRAQLEHSAGWVNRRIWLDDFRSASCGLAESAVDLLRVSFSSGIKEVAGAQGQLAAEPVGQARNEGTVLADCSGLYVQFGLVGLPLSNALLKLTKRSFQYANQAANLGAAISGVKGRPAL
jgi:hypothetical protein